MNGAALYVEVAPGWVWIGGGVYGPDTPQLQAIREHVAEHHAELDAIVRSRGFKKLGGLKGDRLSRVPRGFAKDPSVHLLATFKQFVPLCRFLNEPLVARAKKDPTRFITADGSRD